MLIQRLFLRKAFFNFGLPLILLGNLFYLERLQKYFGPNCTVVAYAAAEGAKCDPPKWIWYTYPEHLSFQFFVIPNSIHLHHLPHPNGPHQRYAKGGHIYEYSNLMLLQKILAPIVSRWRMRRPAAQNVTPKNGYGTPGERRQDGWTLREIFTERKGLIFLYVHILYI